MSSIDTGQRLLTSLVLKKDVSYYYNCKLNENYFVTNAEKELYTFIHSHVGLHGVLPQTETIESILGELPSVVEPPSFYLLEVEERYSRKLFNSTLKGSADFLKDKKITELVGLLEESISTYRTSLSRQNVMDFGVEASALFKHLMFQKYNGITGVLTGWNTLDVMANGLSPGDIFSTVGRPASGKTFMGLWVAYNAYMIQQKNVVFLSMEMNKELITQRMAAIMTRANMSGVMNGLITHHKLNEIYTTLDSLGAFQHKLQIVDGSLKSTVKDVEALIIQYKPELFVIDGAYLLKHDNPKLDRFTRVAENIEKLKQVAEVHKVPFLLSYQFNRKASDKKSKGESAGLEDIAYSDAIGQISSVVLGLTQPESAETLNERTISILKGRSGESGSFNIKWDFDNVNFAEVSSLDQDGSNDSDDTDSHKYAEDFND